MWRKNSSLKGRGAATPGRVLQNYVTVRVCAADVVCAPLRLLHSRSPAEENSSKTHRTEAQPPVNGCVGLSGWRAATEGVCGKAGK